MHVLILEASKNHKFPLRILKYFVFNNCYEKTFYLTDFILEFKDFTYSISRVKCFLDNIREFTKSLLP